MILPEYILGRVELDEMLTRIAVLIAGEESDGHFTLMKFTTCWRAGFSTPSSRGDISVLPMGKTRELALYRAISKYYEVTIDTKSVKLKKKEL